jgi:hypothetical protein
VLNGFLQQEEMHERHYSMKCRVRPPCLTRYAQPRRAP